MIDIVETPQFEIISADPAIVEVIETVGAEIVVVDSGAIEIIEIGIQGASGPGVTGTFISVVWGTPSAESSNKIEILATCLDIDNAVFVSGQVAVELRVSDSAGSNEPSDTAVIQAATIPVGTMLSGTGTATAVFKTDSAGQFKIAVYDVAVGSRFVWLKAGGHSQLFCRAKDGILELTFT